MNDPLASDHVADAPGVPAAPPADPGSPMPLRTGIATPGRGSARPTAPSPFVPMARVAALIGALAAVGIVHVWSHTRVTAAGYRLGELQRTQESLRGQRDRLEIEVATLRAPGRLEEFARTRLKMAPPAAGAVVAGRGDAAARRAGDTKPMVFTATAR